MRQRDTSLRESSTVPGRAGPENVGPCRPLAGMAHSTCEWQVKLCDPIFTIAIPERLRDEQLIIKRYTNEAYFTLLYFMC